MSKTPQDLISEWEENLHREQTHYGQEAKCSQNGIFSFSVTRGIIVLLSGVQHMGYLFI